MIFLKTMSSTPSVNIARRVYLLVCQSAGVAIALSTKGTAVEMSVATGLLFGLAPALQSTRPNIAPTLKDQAGSLMGSGAQVRFRKILVAAQVTLSLLLLIGAGLFIRSLSNLQSLNPGFKTANVVLGNAFGTG